LEEYGIKDSDKPPDTKNLKYSELDLKSVRTLNKLRQYLKKHSIKHVDDFIEEKEELIYSKSVTLGSPDNQKKKNLDFVSSENFFKLLRER
jgi:hypothetical protein